MLAAPFLLAGPGSGGEGGARARLRRRRLAGQVQVDRFSQDDRLDVNSPHSTVHENGSSLQKADDEVGVVVEGGETFPDQRFGLVLGKAEDRDFGEMIVCLNLNLNGADFRFSGLLVKFCPQTVKFLRESVDLEAVLFDGIMQLVHFPGGDGHPPRGAGDEAEKKNGDRANGIHGLIPVAARSTR